MATIKDIAKEAGVSVSTASRALNDNSRISVATRQRIHQIAEQLGYQPNYTAQNLTRGESNMVGLVFPVTTDTAPANPFHIDLMRGVSQALQPHHYEMVVAIAPNDQQLLEEVQSMVTQSKVHNFLIFYTRQNDPVTAYLQKQGLNYVVIGHPESGHSIRYVDNDNVAAGQAAAVHLLNEHHVRQIAFIESADSWTYEHDRATGYRQAMKQRGLVDVTWRVSADEQSLQGYFQRFPDIEALIFSDDLLFVRFVQEVQRLQLPVLCFNNSRLMGMLMRNQEKIDLQPRELGRQAVAVLFNTNLQYQIVDFKIKSK